MIYCIHVFLGWDIIYVWHIKRAHFLYWPYEYCSMVSDCTKEVRYKYVSGCTSYILLYLVVHHVYKHLVGLPLQREHPASALEEQVEDFLLVRQLSRQVKDVLLRLQGTVAVLCKWKDNSWSSSTHCSLNMFATLRGAP